MLTGGGSYVKQRIHLQTPRLYLAFFILVFLLLFYDNSAIGILKRGEYGVNTCSRNDSLLFFILVFLKLFYC